MFFFDSVPQYTVEHLSVAALRFADITHIEVQSCTHPTLLFLSSFFRRPRIIGKCTQMAKMMY